VARLAFEADKLNAPSTSDIPTDWELEPRTRAQAMSSRFRDKWIEAENEELESLIANKTFSPTTLPEGANLVGCKWVYKIKLNADGSVDRFKARLVAQGFTQELGIDYQATFAPVVRASTLRWLIALSVIHGWSRKLADIKTAFLNPTLAEAIFMKQPPGHHFGELGNILRLLKALYGLKQAGRLWYQLLQEFLRSKGFTQSKADPCVFFLRISDTEVVFLAIYVDDICFFGHDSAISKALELLKKEFALRDLGNLDYVLGIQLQTTSSGVLLHQTKYIQTILSRFQEHLGSPVQTPLAHTPILPRLESTAEGYDAKLDSRFDVKLYLEAIGALNHAATYTRIDIATAVSFLSAFNSDPALKHWNAVIRVFNYLQTCADFGIFYSKSGNASPIGYPDAAYNIHSRSRSQLGYVVMLANGPIHWKSTKTKVTCMSSTEAEYMSISDLGRELQSYANLYDALQLPLTKPMLIYEDNLGTIAMCVSDSYTARSKHIAVRYHHIRDLVESGLVKIYHIRTTEQPADLLTKGLHRLQFAKLRQLLGMQSWSDIKQ
jgi:hypothetical protein